VTLIVAAGRPEIITAGVAVAPAAPGIPVVAVVQSEAGHARAPSVPALSGILDVAVTVLVIVVATPPCGVPGKTLGADIVMD